MPKFLRTHKFCSFWSSSSCVPTFFVYGRLQRFWRFEERL